MLCKCKWGECSVLALQRAFLPVCVVKSLAISIALFIWFLSFVCLCVVWVTCIACIGLSCPDLYCSCCMDWEQLLWPSGAGCIKSQKVALLPRTYNGTVWLWGAPCRADKEKCAKINGLNPSECCHLAENRNYHWVLLPRFERGNAFCALSLTFGRRCKIIGVPQTIRCGISRTRPAPDFSW